MTRIITNTVEPMRHDWPAGCRVQGGAAGVVVSRDHGPYRTAFVEAFPTDPAAAFLRGEGATIAEAEDACWAKYQRLVSCEHGDFRRGTYRNGAGYCGHCGTWFPKLFEPLLDGDPAATDTIIGLVAKAQHLPAKPRTAAEPGPGIPGPIEKTVVRWCCPFCPREVADQDRMVKHVPKCWQNPAMKACLSCAYRIRPKKDAPAGCKAGHELPPGPDPAMHCPQWELHPKRAAEMQNAGSGR